MSNQTEQDGILAAAEEIKKQQRKAQRQAVQEQNRQALLPAAEDFLQQHPNLYYVAKSCMYAEWSNGLWHYMKPEALATKYASLFTTKDFDKAFKVALEMQGRSYYDCIHSFKPQSQLPDQLNLLVRDNWLKPIQGEHHPVFDYVVQAMAGGKPENMEHLERCIAFKVEHPECVTLPAILINGEGNLGKNLMVDTILDNVWDGATLAATARNVVGDFNSLCAGKLCILVDETSRKRVDHDELKHRLHREKFEVNTKGVPQYETYNLAWYIIASNKRGGGIWLDRSRADRRYSVFHVDAGLDLFHWIATGQGWMDDHGKPDTIRADLWMEKKGMDICRDKHEVAKWIGYLCNKYAGQTKPRALHGQDYQRLLGIQAPVEEDFLPAVFTDPEFTHIERNVLYEGYKLLCKEDNREPMTSRPFYEIVRTYLRTNSSTISPQEVQKRQGSTHGWVWIRKGCEHRASENSESKYIEQSGYSRKWVGPRG